MPACFHSAAAADGAGVGGAVFVDDFAEDEDFAGTEDVGGGMVEGAPDDALDGEVVAGLQHDALAAVGHEAAVQGEPAGTTAAGNAMAKSTGGAGPCVRRKTL